MKTGNNETIEDIAREMFEYPKSWGEYNHLDWKALAKRNLSAHKREIAAKDAEIAELRECLMAAVREKCPFTRMSCRYGEQCDYECGTEKWRNALKGSNNATK